MKRHHKVIIGSFSTLVIVSLVVIAILLNGIIVKQNIENSYLNQRISQLEDETDGKVNELAVEIINTKSSLDMELININQNLMSATEQINQLKVESGEDFSGVIEEVIDSIVIIRTLTAQGSGFFINSGGFIVTNKHVLVNENGEISRVIQVVKSNNKMLSGELIGYITDLDLALIKVGEESSFIELESSENVKIGEKVIAIGTPQGLQFSATDGIVSAVNRSGFGNSGTYVQTNAQLNSGNSGGPLINKKGKVIGMNNFKLVDSEGIGFALEADKIKLGINEIGIQLLNQTLIS